MPKLLLLALLPALAAVADEAHDLVAIYQDLHEHPELSYHEERSSALLAAELRKAGYDVAEHFGKYASGEKPYGVVAILKNGAGPTVLVRTDMDALPVEEKTGLPYASRNAGVMHACGHDLHMTVWLGAAHALAESKSRWHGTLMFIGQPAEERVGGARSMLDGGLYARFGKPDYALALHDDPRVAAGQVGVTAGPLLAGANQIEVVIRGVGGHGARPDTTKDPVVAAAQFVLALQTIVSRQTEPRDPAVVTVGSIHGGTRPNIIPDEVKLEISTRAFREEVLKNIRDDIERTARGVALTAGIPEDRAPTMTVLPDSAPVTYNDPALAGRFKAALAAALGGGNVIEMGPEMASEDFGLFGLEGRQIPVFMLRLGASDPEKLRESLRTAKPLPSLHSSLFAPVAEAAIRTGVAAMVAMVGELMGK